MRNMTVIEARNDLAIETVDLIDRFPFYARAVEADRAADEKDAEKMIRLLKTKSEKARRQAQSGVDPDLVGIERELAKLGYAVLIERDRWGTTGALGSTISFKEQYTSGSWGRPTGKFTLHVEHVFTGEKKWFPQRADGSFNYAKVARVIVDNYMSAQAQAERAQAAAAKKQTAGELVAELVAELGVKPDTLIKPTLSGYRNTWGRKPEYFEYPAEAGKVWLDVGSRQATPEQAKIVIAALREAGLL